MFNQKINHELSQNPDYVNKSFAAPYIRPADIHKCGTTVLKYNKNEKCGSLPLQSWCSKNVAVESFAMRPIVNSQEYFENIKKYLANLILTDSVDLKKSGLKNEKYTFINDYSTEPNNSFLQAIELNVTDRLNDIMAGSSDKIEIFKNYNPICEGFIINDIEIQTYQSDSNKNHFFHKIVFAAVNTTRYNTVSFRADIYQDTQPIMEAWNQNINKVENSKDVKQLESSQSIIYISFIDLLNNTSCVVGQESECEFKGYDLNNSTFKNIINQNNFAEIKETSWLNYPSLGDTTYNQQGNYDSFGNLKIVDTGPSNFDNLLSSFLN